MSGEKELERYLYYPEMSPRRTYDLRLLRVFALVLIVIGMTGIYFSAYNTPAPLTPIKDLLNNYLLNYATVMIEGRIVEPVGVDVQSGGRLRLTLYIQDSSIDMPLQVFVYDPVASSLLASPEFPNIGDFVRLIIQLRVREDFTYGILQSPSHIQVLQTPSDAPRYVSSLDNVEAFTYVCTEGMVLNPRQVSSGLLFYITSSNGSITVLVPRVLSYIYMNNSSFSLKLANLSTPGVLAEVCGIVYYYRGTSPEIIPRRADEIRIKEVEEVSPGELHYFVGRAVSLTGVLERISYDSLTRTYSLYIESQGYEIIGVSSSREMVASWIDPWSVGQGSKVRISGIVIDPITLNISRVTILDPIPPPNLTIMEALRLEYGRLVILWNVRVVSSSVTSTGNWIIDVADETGSIRIFVPSSAARGMGALPPQPGSIIAVAGYRDVYNNVEEVVVYSETGITNLSQFSQEYKMIDISDVGLYIGEKVSFKGILFRIRYSSSEGLYYVEFSNTNQTIFVNVSMRRDVLSSAVNPFESGIGSLLEINGTVLNSTMVSADRLRLITPVKPLIMSIEQAIAQPYGFIVVIANVTVSSSINTSGGNWIIDVSDSTGSIRVFVPQGVASRLSLPLPVPGDRISVAGYRDVYNNVEEIVVFSEVGLRVEAFPPPPPTYISVSIEEIANYQGRNVSFIGVLMSVRYISPNYYLTFSNINKTVFVNVTVSRDILSGAINPFETGVNSVFRVNGTVQTSSTVSGHSLTLVNIVPPPVLTVSQALEQPLGVIIVLQNVTVVAARATSGNDWQINVTDPSGAVILVFIPRSVVSEIGLNLPSPGDVISVAGYRDVYGATQEIVIYSRQGFIKW
ncbi:MAG: hypothetical protein QXO22_07245 [Thermosphaera sp.]